MANNIVPMERIVNDADATEIDDAPDILDVDEEYATRVVTIINEAVDFEESVLQPDRVKDKDYYRGVEPKLPERTIEGAGDEVLPTSGRSKMVSTDVKDTVLAIMPSLMRIFTSGTSVVNFKPNHAGQVDMAQQATDYVNYVFLTDNDGFTILHSVFKDALTTKVGITKWWTDNTREVKHRQYTNVPIDPLVAMIEDYPSARIVELTQDPFNPDMAITATIEYTVDNPVHRVAAVPPEEFRIHPDAKSIDEALVVGHEREVYPSELIAMGYTEDEIEGFIGRANLSLQDEEKFQRTGRASVTSSDRIPFGEWYIRIDQDGDGIDELRYIHTLGDRYNIVYDVPTDSVNFAIWCPDPVPHTVVGDSVTDMVRDIQEIKTTLLRASLDSAGESIRPRTYVNEITTNISDALNDETGAVVRVRGDPNTAVAYPQVPFVGDKTFTMMDRIDQIRQSRTGISEASKGLDPKALQSTAVTGVDAIVTGAQERIELIARILCETGMKRMMRGLLNEITNNPPSEARVVELRGKWTAVKPSLYDASMRCETNPCLGKGTDIMRLQTLSSIKNDQLMVIEKFGINNPIVGVGEILNTITDILALSNIKDVARYFRTPTPEVLAAIQNTPKEPDAATLLAQAELEKTKKDVIVTQAKLDQDDKRLSMDDDFRRDKLAVDIALNIIDTLKTIGDPAERAAEETRINANNQPG